MNATDRLLVGFPTKLEKSTNNKSQPGIVPIIRDMGPNRLSVNFTAIQVITQFHLRLYTVENIENK